MHYLNEDDIGFIYSLLSEKAREGGEILPSFSIANNNDIAALVDIPQRQLFGIDQYPTIEAKATIIFYTINKKHIFINGNKRMSTLCLLVFLRINEKSLDVDNDQLTEKALWLANTIAQDFHNVKLELEKWIKERLAEK